MWPATDIIQVGCMLFGAAAWRCAPRDRHLGWSSEERSRALGRGANNTRFLVLPWARVPHLASQILGAVARRIDADGHRGIAVATDGIEVVPQSVMMQQKVEDDGEDREPQDRSMNDAD